MKILDLFAGAGGLSCGFKMAGFKSVFAIDMNEKAIQTYNYNLENVGKTIDIKKMTEEDIKKFEGVDGIIGGPPCQGFSMAGERVVSDDRNNLYLDFIRFVRILKPKFFVMENVKGLLSMDSGRILKEIIKRFEKIGYSVEYKVLKASDYGVPQNRERVFFIGRPKDERAIGFPMKINKKVTTLEALSDMPSSDVGNDHTQYISQPKNSYQRFLRKGSSEVINNNEFTNHKQKTIDIISHVPDGGGRRDLPKKFKNVRKFNAAFNRMPSWGQSRTIDTGHRNYFHYSDNRIPTVRESARIQSFPDNFIFLGSRTDAYRQVGNAVPPLLAKAIASHIKKEIYSK